MPAFDTWSYTKLKGAKGFKTYRISGLPRVDASL